MVVVYYLWCGLFGGCKVELELFLMVFVGIDDDWMLVRECEGVKLMKVEL